VRLEPETFLCERAELGERGDRLNPREGYVRTDGGRLFLREIGEGQPTIVLHGGPDFDHTYLLPELDRLAGELRLVYYDQRGRGRSAEGVRAEDVGIDSEMDDLERVRRHLDLESVAVLGHSWGGLLAMEYATRHPDRVSHLVLMNTGPASHDDCLLLRRYLVECRPADELERMRAVAATDRYLRGELDAEADYYRIHFRPAVFRPEVAEQVVGRLRSEFTPETVLVAREIEQRLYDQTWGLGDYDLTPALARLDIPTLVIHGDHDFVPLDIAVHIAEAVPGAVLHVLEDCGHFAYLEQPEEVRSLMAAFFGRT
jgi:proline iminopeptidase